MMKNQPQDIKTLDGLGEWCAMRNWKLQNPIASCFEKFTDPVDHVYHDQYFSHHNDAKYSRYNTAAFPMTSFQ